MMNELKKPFPSSVPVTSKVIEDIKPFANMYHGNVRLSIGHLMTVEDELAILKHGLIDTKIN